ncbi:hypothetical protein FGO68_gene15846 [Halteria grandinella]|uniref:Uncharacterized protein n=1 Tax=Halteria grandinella TaxID=5974 RepID=A0A8J8SUN5_HALGN|nr:hypothetical protein FGO68_gene15846 [Halteria grandinella]
MNTKFIVLMTLLIMATYGSTVNKSDQCSACTQFKSQSDCQTLGTCTWTAGTGTTAGSCATTPKAADPTAYCPGVENPGTNCAKTYGCAYLDSKCTHFAGCSAYVKGTTSDCQAISTNCISDGTVCTDALACDKYSTSQCASTPDLNGRKCTVDSTSNACRNYTCAEADNTLTLNSACEAFSAGCVTTGQGCIASLPTCSNLTGTEATCPLMKGSDGYCKFGSGTNCAQKTCTDAPNSTATNPDCVSFLAGCVTTGKGCIATLGACNSYTVANPVTDCTGYVGTDGVCEGDAGGSACRARKCENGTGTTNDLCGQYKKGCVTNGKACVTAKAACSTYSGTITTCAGLIGSDGNCKGTSTTVGPCTPKLCDVDSVTNASSYTSDDKCSAIQLTCKSTGAGCVATLASCSTYTATLADGSDCLTRIGSEGRCKAPASGTKCTAKLCTDAPATTTTNPQCNTFQFNCVTNGAGCISQSSCLNTVKQVTCLGTLENSAYCNWNPICVASTQCSSFPTQAICAANKTSSSVQCIWDKTLNQCRNALCKDYTATTDGACNTLLLGCVTNGTICADPNTCSQFAGLAATCEAFTAFCTGGTPVAATTPCVSRTCDNASTSFNSDSQCSQYLNSCLTNGAGCIDATKDCSYYKGTSTTCENFTGYVSSTAPRVKCWSNSSSDAFCIQRSCSLATSMTSDTDCGNFLSGCLYNGNGKCVDATAVCSTYGYISDATLCQSFKGNGATKCWQDKNNANKCKDRECGDYAGTNPSNSDCDNHLTGCISTGTGCVPSTTPCSQFTTQTVDFCNALVANSKQCTKITTCKSKVCSEKNSSVTANTDCTSFHSKCRLGNIGAKACTDAQPSCTKYTFGTKVPGTDDAAIQNYCNSVSTNTKSNCAWDTTSLYCIARTSCGQWVDGVTTATCADYLGTKTCVQNSDDDICYAIGKCTAYSIPSSVINATGQTAWCGAISDNASTPVTCVYDAAQSTSTCSYTAVPTTCEGITSSNSAAACNTTLSGVWCQYYSTKCYTTQSSCSSYIPPTGSEANFCAGLKQDNNGAVTKCKFANGATTCSASVCSDVSSPTKQDDCDAVVSGCTFQTNACYTTGACNSYTPTGNDNAAKRIVCQNKVNTAGAYCSYIDGGTTCSDPITDCTQFSGSSTDQCGLYRLGTGQACMFVANAQKCSAPAATDVCTAVTAIATASCDLYTTVGACVVGSGNCGAAAACTTKNYTNQATDATVKATACQAYTGAAGFCSWVSNSSNCDDAPANCSSWASLTASADNTAYCQARIDNQGNKCAYDMGSTACRIGLACEFAQSPGSQVDCDILSTGCTYFSGLCYVQKSDCNLYTATSSGQLAHCGKLKTSSGGNCTFMTTALSCVNKSLCSSYTALGATAQDKKTACNAISTTDANGCTYWGTGTTCMAIKECSAFSVSPAADLISSCAAQVDKNGKTCFGTTSATACAQFDSCESITGAQNSGGCDKYITGCTFYQNKCFTPSNTCAYIAPGANSISYCGGLTNSSTNQKCTASSDTATTCQDRTCSDAATLTMTTNSACNTYKTGCKSDGTKCIDGTLQCSQFSASDCKLAVDSDNSSLCIEYASTCIDKACSINDTSTTDTDCINFRSGCLTNGKGCVESTVPCSSYQGTADTCQNFTGNNIKCWSKSATIDYCRDRQCSDNTTATKDDECDQFLSGCVTNGAGCLPKNSACGAFKGTQDICKTFNGSKGFCWNTSLTAASNCVDRVCTQYTGTTDTDCATFIAVAANAKPACVTNGKNCVPSSTTCSEFKGTYLTCPNFTASDGPCKASNYSTTEAVCQPRVCTEASNSLATDTDCKQYHPTCVTTGRGCIAQTSFNCGQIQNQTACSAKTGQCIWANQCRAAPPSCSSLTSSGQSICTNTLLSDGQTKCAWSSSGTGTCRNFLCTDYDATLTTHKACHDKDPSCTTSGAGCVGYSTCSTYSTPSICAAAQTTETEIQCTWDTTKSACRARVCSDSTATTDTDCNTFLAGCKTSGTGCVGPKFYCAAFSTQALCQKDGYGNPCLWANNACYNYADCTDGTGSSLTDCQKFNPLCVPSSTTCIAQTSCDKYTEQASCTVGINSAVCGWLPSGKCQVFGACADATGGSSDSACKFYGSTCITDGTNCVTKGQCSSYLTQTACESTNWGTDGQCKWAVSGTTGSCRLAVCTDKTATTDSDCLAYIVSTGKCTTDGTTCVARAACNTYTTQTACTIGSDGIPCIYAYPVGQTTGTQSCRVKECSDITGTTNDQCIGQIAGKSCVSNGKTCVKQDTCANYKNKLSCNGGGSDGACAFTPAATATDVLAGTCQLFTSCDKANNDSAACNTKQSACQWTSTVSGTTTTTSCAAKNCVQAASGTTCNYIPSFDGTKYTICNLVNNVCTTSDPSTLAQGICYSKSAYTYTWNESTSKCVPCNGSSSINNTVNNTNSTNNSNTTTTNGYILGVTIPLAILGLFA